MKKTYKEKYYELKKENEYLHILINNKHTDFKILQLEFSNFRKNIKEKEDRDNLIIFVSFLVGMLIAGIVAIISLL